MNSKFEINFKIFFEMEIDDNSIFNTTDYKQTGQNLGEGTFGSVYLVEKITDKSQFAAKTIKIQSIFSGTEQIQLMRESSRLCNINHPSLVKFHGINFHSFQEQNLLQPTILTEYVNGISLEEIFKQLQKGKSISFINSTQKHIFLLGISSAMKHLHEKGIFHLDLKPSNILIEKSNDINQYYPKISDFGLSKCFSKSFLKSIKNEKSTLFYNAPELQNNNGDDCFYNVSDVYSFASIAYEIVCCEKDYSKSDVNKFIQKVISGGNPKFDKSITKSMQKLLIKCWSANVDERPSFSDIFNQLSTEFSYFKDDVDSNKIKNYLSYLENSEPTAQISEQQSLKQANEIIQRNDRNVKRYLELIKLLIEYSDSIQYLYTYQLDGNVLHLACETGNFNLVKYILSLDKIDIKDKTVLFCNNFVKFSN